MAYITTEQVAEFRAELKKEFPDIKFSVTREHYCKINVAIMQAHFRFTENDYHQVNEYRIKEYQYSDILSRIKEICNRGNYNNSDSQSDYFDVGWYFSLSIGKWDKPFVLKEAKPKPVKNATVKEVLPVKGNLISRVLNVLRVF